MLSSSALSQPQFTTYRSCESCSGLQHTSRWTSSCCRQVMRRPQPLQLEFNPLRMRRAEVLRASIGVAAEGFADEGPSTQLETTETRASTGAVDSSFCFIESKDSVKGVDGKANESNPAAASNPSPPSSAPTGFSPHPLPEGLSEGPLISDVYATNPKNFSHMQLEEIQESIATRRNKIFLLMEEVRRLRIQQRLKGEEPDVPTFQALALEKYPSVIPFLPPLSDETVPKYFQFYISAVSVLIIFGGLLAPILEVKLGLGGTSYADFIGGLKLPSQLASVDPIVASFCGGSVGVLSTLMVVEANNAKMQAKGRCTYCSGTGYLTCGNCVGSGRILVDMNGSSTNGGPGQQEGCPYCSSTGKVMCTSCLCTGRALATEHDPRFDPFQ